MDVLIRPFAPEHRGAVIALWRDSGLTRWYNDPDQDLDLFHAKPNSAVFVALEQGNGDADDQERLVGCICVGHDGHRGWLYYLATDPAERGQGIARKLVEASETWLRDQGIAKVQLMIRPTNQAALGFYQAIGYELNPCVLRQRWLVDRGEPPEGLDEEHARRDGGKLAVTITYLEMRERPNLAHIHPPIGTATALIRARWPTISFYRYLYNTVGEPWIWYERRAMDDETLGAIIRDPAVEVYVLYIDGVPAGYVELDRRNLPDVDIAFFGLVPDYIGRGLGQYLLASAIDLAWTDGTERLLVNTCTLDHVGALPLYQRFGFTPYERKEIEIDDPRLTGLLPPDAGKS